MDTRKVAYWVLEIAGTFLSIAVVINIVLGQRDYPLYIGLFGSSLALIWLGSTFRPGYRASP